jgi:hypothetical protein
MFCCHKKFIYVFLNLTFKNLIFIIVSFLCLKFEGGKEEEEETNSVIFGNAIIRILRIHNFYTYTIYEVTRKHKVQSFFSSFETPFWKKVNLD